MVGGTGIGGSSPALLRPAIADMAAALKFAETLDWIIRSKDLRDLLAEDIRAYVAAADRAEVGADLDRARANARKIEADAAGRLTDAQMAAAEVLQKADARLAEAKREAGNIRADATKDREGAKALLQEASQAREEAQGEAKRLEGLSRDLTVLKTSLDARERDLAARQSKIEATLASLRA